MRKIAIEEHFATPEYFEIARGMLRKEHPGWEAVAAAEGNLGPVIGWTNAGLKVKTADGELVSLESLLVDVGEKRIKIMDAEGIDVQVLSHAQPAVQMLDSEIGTALSKRINNWLAEKIKVYPDRFVGLATIAPQSPIEAADELERAVKELGMRGVSINSHTRGEYLDDRKFWPILETAERLDVPIYIHPRSPSPAILGLYADYPEMVHAVHGFGVEANYHAMRLVCSDVFDQYPGLKIILGHLGEAIPYAMWRIDNRYLDALQGQRKRKRLPMEYFVDNFVVTTSGCFSLPPFLCTYMALGADRILFAVDYPFQGNWEATPFFDNLEISPVDKEKIMYKNAERLFRIGR